MVLSINGGVPLVCAKKQCLTLHYFLQSLENIQCNLTHGHTTPIHIVTPHKHTSKANKPPFGSWVIKLEIQNYEKVLPKKTGSA